MQRFGIVLAGQDIGPQAGQTVLGQSDFTRQVQDLIKTRGIDPDGIFTHTLLGSARIHRLATRPVAGPTPVRGGCSRLGSSLSWHAGSRRHGLPAADASALVINSLAAGATGAGCPATAACNAVQSGSPETAAEVDGAASWAGDSMATTATGASPESALCKPAITPGSAGWG
jgi:hypothetical protein